MKRSLELLHELEVAGGQRPIQLDLFRRAAYDASALELDGPEPAANELLQELIGLDLNNLTPLEALQVLSSWQNKARAEGNNNE